jgi:hypothetical protein
MTAKDTIALRAASEEVSRMTYALRKTLLAQSSQLKAHSS